MGENVDGRTFYVDFERIRKHGGYVYYWYLRDFLKPEKWGDMSSKLYNQGDCKLFRYKYLSYFFHKEPMGGGVGNLLNEVDKNWTPWFFWGLNLLLLMAFLYLLWKYRSVKNKQPVKEAPALPTHKIALHELDTLKRKGLLDRGEAREHFFELSEIFRRYLGKRYNFPAPDWTTDEITEYFQKQDKFESVSYVEAIRILNKSDLIKFAKVKALPGADEIESASNIYFLWFILKGGF